MVNRRDRRRAAIAATLADCLDDRKLSALVSPYVGVGTLRSRARVTLDMRGCAAEEVGQVAERCIARVPASVSLSIRVR